MKTTGLSLVLSVDEPHSSPITRKVVVSLEDPQHAQDFLAALNEVDAAAAHLHSNSTFIPNIDVELNVGAKSPSAVPSVSVHKCYSTSQMMAEDEDYDDQTSTPPSEFEPTWPCNSIRSDVKRLTSAYSAASPALRIIMEELHKLRAEQGRQAARQEALHKQIQRALLEKSAANLARTAVWHYN